MHCIVAYVVLRNVIVFIKYLIFLIIIFVILIMFDTIVCIYDFGLISYLLLDIVVFICIPILMIMLTQNYNKINMII